jgi:hypothetical protein
MIEKFQRRNGSFADTDRGNQAAIDARQSILRKLSRSRQPDRDVQIQHQDSMDQELDIFNTQNQGPTVHRENATVNSRPSNMASSHPYGDEKLVEDIFLVNRGQLTINTSKNNSIATRNNQNIIFTSHSENMGELF